jgi:SAM-dependent methyltransferase
VSWIHGRKEGAMTDLATVKEHQQGAWAARDFSMFATTIVIVSERLCETVDLRAGQRVLDVACGSGNTAIAAARRGCGVVGLDFVPGLLERGRERAAAERLDVEFIEGDAEDLPFPDGSFDVVLSTFGAMFAPDQERTAHELLRVLRPGGSVGMANFPPHSLAAGFFFTAAKFSPPPRGIRPAILWGSEESVRELFGDGVVDLQLHPQEVLLRYRSAEDWLEFFRRHFGPIGVVFETLTDEKRARFGRELMDLVIEANRSGDGTICAPVDYVEVVAKKRGPRS